MTEITILSLGLIIESIAVMAIAINQILFNIRLTKLWQKLQRQREQKER